MYPIPETTEYIVFRILFVTLWIGIGIFLSHRLRGTGWEIKVLIAILFTKGFICYWIIYYPYLLIKKFRQGMKEGNIEKQQKTENNKGET